jgi:HEAT repeat protein
MAHVFISYSSKDSEFVKELDAKLNEARIKSWTYTRELFAGNHWEREIDEAIKASFVVLVVMTPDAKKSEYVTYEWSFAFGIGKLVIPIHLKTVKKWHPKLDESKIQNLDFRNGKRPYIELISTLIRQQPNLSSNVASSDYLDKKYHLALEGETENIRVGAIHDIEKSSHSKVTDTLVKLIENGHLPDTKINAGLVIARKTEYKDIRALPALLLGIKQDNHYKSQVIQSIRKYGEAAIDGLIELLDAKWKEARRLAALLLGEMKAKKAVPKFIEMVNQDSDREVQLQVISSLVAIEDNTALPAIRESFRNQPSDIALIAFAVFRQVEDFPLIISALHRYGQDIILDAARKAVRQIGKNIAPYLREAIVSEESNEAIAINCIDLLGDVDDGLSTPLLLDMLEHPKFERRKSAIYALGQIGDEASINVLETLLDNHDGVTAEAGIRALVFGKFEPTKVIPTLIQALNHTNMDVQELAAYGLGELKAEEAIMRLLELDARIKDKEDSYALHATIQQALNKFSKEQIDKATNNENQDDIEA